LGSAGPAVNINHSDDIILAARIIVRGGAGEMDLAPTEPARRLAQNFLFAQTHGFLSPEAMIVAAIVVAVAIIGAVLSIIIWPARILRSRGKHSPAGVVILSASTPGEVKSIALGTPLLILDANHGHSTVSRIADQ